MSTNLHFVISPFVEMNINSSFQEFEIISQDQAGLEVKIKANSQTGDLYKLLEEEKTGTITSWENPPHSEKPRAIRLKAIQKKGAELILKCLYCTKPAPTH